MPAGTCYAGFWRRLLAVLLDLVLLASILAPVLYLVYGPDYFVWRHAGPRLFSAYGLIDVLLTKLLPLTLLVGLWSWLGATPGKLLMGCRVVNAADGKPVSMRQATLRAFGYLASLLPFYLGFLWIAWDRRKQGFHDKIAHTVVIRYEDDYGAQSLQALRGQLQ